MKRVWMAVALVGLVVACADTPAELTEGPAFSEGQVKAVLCHDTGTDGYVRIEIADRAMEAHIDHGDAGPGETVPGMEDKRFTDLCGLEDPVVCPCFATPADVDYHLGDLYPSVKSVNQMSVPMPGETNYESWILGDGTPDSAMTFYSTAYGGGGSCYISAQFPPNIPTEVWSISFEEANACHNVLLEYAASKGLPCTSYADPNFEPWCEPYPAVPWTPW